MRVIEIFDNIDPFHAAFVLVWHSRHSNVIAKCFRSQLMVGLNLIGPTYGGGVTTVSTFSDAIAVMVSTIGLYASFTRCDLLQWLRRHLYSGRRRSIFPQVNQIQAKYPSSATLVN